MDIEGGVNIMYNLSTLVTISESSPVRDSRFLLKVLAQRIDCLSAGHLDVGAELVVPQDRVGREEHAARD